MAITIKIYEAVFPAAKQMSVWIGFRFLATIIGYREDQTAPACARNMKCTFGKN